MEKVDASSVKFAAAKKCFRCQFGEISDANSARNTSGVKGMETKRLRAAVCAIEPPRWCPLRCSPFGVFLFERGDQVEALPTRFEVGSAKTPTPKEVGEWGFPKGEN